MGSRAVCYIQSVDSRQSLGSYPEAIGSGKSEVSQGCGSMAGESCPMARISGKLTCRSRQAGQTKTSARESGRSSRCSSHSRPPFSAEACKPGGYMIATGR